VDLLGNQGDCQAGGLRAIGMGIKVRVIFSRECALRQSEFFKKCGSRGRQTVAP
jgi:hypothetical protein